MPVFDKEPGLRIHRVQILMTHESAAGFRQGRAKAEHASFIKSNDCAPTSRTKCTVAVHNRYLTTVVKGRNGRILSIRIRCSLCKRCHSTLHRSLNPACIVSNGSQSLHNSPHPYHAFWRWITASQRVVWALSFLMTPPTAAINQSIFRRALLPAMSLFSLQRYTS